ncbi:MAG: sigma 54-interacting transcriptional regulator, partial [Ignavibacterium sp.]
MKQYLLDVIYTLSTKRISPKEFSNPNKYLFWFFENLKPIYKEVEQLIFTHIQFFDFTIGDNEFFRDGRLIGFPTLYGTTVPDHIVKINNEIITFLIAVSLMQKTNFEGIRASINTFQDRMIIESISKESGDKFSVHYDDSNKVISFNLPDLYETKISNRFYEIVKNNFKLSQDNIDERFILLDDASVNNTIELLFTSGLAQSFLPDVVNFLNFEKVVQIANKIIKELTDLNKKFGLAYDDNNLKNFVYTGLLHSWIKSYKFNYMITSVRYDQHKQPTSYAILVLVTDKKVKREILNLLHITLNVAFSSLNEIHKWSDDKLTSKKVQGSLHSEQARKLSSLIYKSSVMQKLDKEIDLIAKTNESVLLIGEVGVGKDLIALEIHKRTNPNKDFKVIKGEDYELDFINDKNLTSYGTIYFPEITDIPLDLQRKLLQYLRNHTPGILGSINNQNHFEHRTRFIFASNTDLLKSIKSGKLREDFYFQINVVNLIIPSLRERLEDIQLLAEHFVKFHSLRIKG